MGSQVIFVVLESVDMLDHGVNSCGCKLLDIVLGIGSNLRFVSSHTDFIMEMAVTHWELALEGRVKQLRRAR